MGDPAGIGPEIAVRACSSPKVLELCQPVIFGDPQIVRKAAREFLVEHVEVRCISSPSEARADKSRIFVVACTAATEEIKPGAVQAEAGRLAVESVVAATRATLAAECAAVVTAPINKEAMHLAGFHYPGHTELLAHLCGARAFAMLLYLALHEGGEEATGITVAHVTLHTPLREIFSKITKESILEKIELLDDFIRNLKHSRHRLGVASLNPHGGEHGIFGKEEDEVISPAVAQARQKGINVEGPLPADTLFLQAVQGQFDGVVAMYHDQGHIPIKLLGMHRAVNVTVGLPIVRTSVAHGTAFDIAWQGRASPESLIEAIRLAVQLARGRIRHRVDLRNRVSDTEFCPLDRLLSWRKSP